MIVVKLMGGLGNQLFQYACGRALSTQLKTELVLDLDTLLDRSPREHFVFREFDLDLFKLDTYFVFDQKHKKKFNRKSIFSGSNLQIKEKGFQYMPVFENLKKKQHIYLDGYWQSYKYFEKISDKLKKEFQFNLMLTEQQLQLRKKLIQSKSVCVNFRRADFVTIPSAVQTHGASSLHYYKKAIDYLKTRLGNDLQFFVFSDDIEWCKTNFTSELPVFFVTHDPYKGERFSSYLQLMTFCKHFIIPNSTFGWWAAWLANYEDKIVITPKQWFADPLLQSQTHDLRPKSWITIDA
jgi:hypothetical protein